VMVFFFTWKISNHNSGEYEFSYFSSLFSLLSSYDEWTLNYSDVQH
jgi:hypothetical protein